MRQKQIISTLPNSDLRFEDLKSGETYKVFWNGSGKPGQAVYLLTDKGSFRLAASRAQRAGTPVASGAHNGMRVVRVAITGEYEVA